MVCRIVQSLIRAARGNDHCRSPAWRGRRRETPFSGAAQFRHPQPGPAASLPKELTQDEVAALLAGADRDGRQLCAILLLGLTADEVKELAFSDLDLKSLRLTVRGASARTLPLPNWLALALARDSAGDPDRPLFCDSLGKPLSASDIGARVTCVALDSGIDDATYVTPEALRHTYIDNLMRQKVRFSDLAAFAGKLSAEKSRPTRHSIRDHVKRKALKSIPSCRPCATPKLASRNTPVQLTSPRCASRRFHRCQANGSPDGGEKSGRSPDPTDFRTSPAGSAQPCGCGPGS
ncbi:MAG: site-specific integrase [Propionivibrio sp.]|nr:site-specific integrase [Propionivibrio sp.]